MVHIKSMNYRITGNSGIEVKVELSLTAAILQEFSYKAIIAASTDEEHPVLKDSKAALIIYYAEAGESLWNIARQYYTSVNAIKEENDLSDDNVVSKGMLFIPV
ncbi:MAG: LysM peptidoglycan-binding domain-containing protein [Eubacteriales bacterium]